jgi:hypothetical protein
MERIVSIGSIINYRKDIFIMYPKLDQYDFHNAIKATNNEFRVIKYD